MYQRPNSPSPNNDVYQRPKPPPSNVNIYHRPDGPDYSLNGAPNQSPNGGRRVNNLNTKNKLPLTIGLDVYPVLGSHGKKSASLYSNSRESGTLDENLHEVLLKLNLFSRKPQLRGGDRRKGDNDDASTISLGPFSYNANGYVAY